MNQPNVSQGKSPAAAPAAAAPRTIPKGLINLSERFPQYEPGVDARDIKKNLHRKGNVLHGYLLAELVMPATIADQETGELKEWRALCFELIDPCPGRFQDPENPDRVEERVVPAGGKMLLTKTTAMASLFERGLELALRDPDQVYEVYLEPQVGKTKGGQSLWLFPVCGVGNPIKRESKHMVTLPAARAPAALPPKAAE